MSASPNEDEKSARLPPEADVQFDIGGDFDAIHILTELAGRVRGQFLKDVENGLRLVLGL